MREQSVRVSQRKGGAPMIRARRLSTAKHEVGHVIPMLALSLPFKNVEIIPGEIANRG